MKKLLIFCGLLFGVITFSHAQDGQGRRGGSPEERLKKQVETLAEKLNLDDGQKTKITALYKEQFSRMRQLRDSVGNDRAAMRDAMMKANQENEAKVMAILNDAQKSDYKTWREEQREARRKWMQENGRQ